MKTRGEVEALICEGVAHFMQEFMGRGPTEIRTHLIGNLLVVRLKGILTPADAVIQESTGLRCVSMHHDISTITGEEVFVFTLSDEMNLRETKRK